MQLVNANETSCFLIHTIQVTYNAGSFQLNLRYPTMNRRKHLLLTLVFLFVVNAKSTVLADFVVVLRAGERDQFAAPYEESTQRYGGPYGMPPGLPLRDFDEPGNDRFLLQSFDLSLYAGRIIDATLKFHAQPNNNVDAYNDNLQIYPYQIAEYSCSASDGNGISEI